jgi:hypothetical protein
MKILYPFHSFIRRNLALVEHLVAAVALALLLYGLMRTIAVYPLYWNEVIAAVVFVLTLISPVAGYFVGVAAAIYPLYSISLYLAVIFLAVAILGQHLFINNLGATLLTFSSPLLGSVYLAWGIPMLGGLWWGPVGGALMGGLAALWGLLFAGMTGLLPDWVKLYGVLPILEHLPERFAQTGSLETLQLLFLPLMPDSTFFLYCLLQIASWAFVGWAVGMFSEKEWSIYHRPRSSMIIVLIGSSVLAGMQVLLSQWLEMPILPGAQTALGLTALLSALAVMGLEWGDDFFEHPLPIPASTRSPRVEVPPAPVVSNPIPDAAPLASSEIPKSQESRKSDDEDDLIMLELD